MSPSPRLRSGSRLATALGVIALLLVAGCSEEDAGDDYYEAMEKIEYFSGTTETELDEFAESACGLIEAAQDSGMSEEEAFDNLFRSMHDFGLNEADALMASLNVARFHCPVDLSN